MVKKETGQRKEKVKHQDTIADMIEALLRSLATFSKHVFTFRWQFLQFKTLLSKVPASKAAVAVCDFAENYLCPVAE